MPLITTPPASSTYALKILFNVTLRLEKCASRVAATRTSTRCSDVLKLHIRRRNQFPGILRASREPPRVLEGRSRSRERGNAESRGGKGGDRGKSGRLYSKISLPPRRDLFLLPFRLPFAARYRGNELLYAKFMEAGGDASPL